LYLFVVVWLLKSVQGFVSFRFFCQQRLNLNFSSERSILILAKVWPVIWIGAKEALPFNFKARLNSRNDVHDF
jgi:hypothetical protein